MSQTIYFDVNPAHKNLTYHSAHPLERGEAKFRYLHSDPHSPSQVAEIIGFYKTGVACNERGTVTNIVWEVVVQPEGETGQHTLEVRTPAITFDVVAEGVVEA